MTSQICELAYNAVPGPTHRYRDRRPRRVPRVGNRVILPSLALLAEGDSIEPTHNIDFAVAGIIHCGWEITTSGIWHGRTHCPGVRRNIVDLRRSQDKEVRVDAAEDINLVGVRGISDPCVIEASCHVRQRGPAIRDRVILVKSVLWEPGGNATC